MSEALHDRLLEYLDQKGRIGFRRICEDFRVPPQQLEAALNQLRRQNLAWAPAAGEWERKAPPGTQYIPPADPPSALPVAAVAQVMAERPVPIPRPQPVRTPESTDTGAPPASISEETPMARGKGKKTCAKCKQAKGPTAFFAGDDVCRFCHGGKTAKARKTHGMVGEKRGNGHVGGSFAGAIAALRAERELVADRLAKFDQAIAQLEAFG